METISICIRFWVGCLKSGGIMDLVNPLPPLVANEDTTIVLFFVDMTAQMSMDGTISGLKDLY